MGPRACSTSARKRRPETSISAGWAASRSSHGSVRKPSGHGLPRRGRARRRPRALNACAGPRRGGCPSRPARSPGREGHAVRPRRSSGRPRASGPIRSAGRRAARSNAVARREALEPLAVAGGQGPLERRVAGESVATRSASSTSSTNAACAARTLVSSVPSTRRVSFLSVTASRPLKAAANGSKAISEKYATSLSLKLPIRFPSRHPCSLPIGLVGVVGNEGVEHEGSLLHVTTGLLLGLALAGLIHAPSEVVEQQEARAPFVRPLPGAAGPWEQEQTVRLSPKVERDLERRRRELLAPPPSFQPLLCRRCPRRTSRPSRPRGGSDRGRSGRCACGSQTDPKADTRAA